MNIVETSVGFTFGTLHTFGGDTRDMGESGRCCRAKCHTVVHSAIVGNFFVSDSFRHHIRKHIV